MNGNEMIWESGMSLRGSVPFWAATLLLTGCVAQPISVVSSMVTSQERIQLDKPAMQSTFGLDEVVFVLVYVTWPDVTTGAGEHTAEWNWYRGDQLVSHAHTTVHFNSAPSNLNSGRPASALGAGSYKVDTILDGKVLSTNAFVIKP